MKKFVWLIGVMWAISGCMSNEDGKMVVNMAQSAVEMDADGDGGVNDDAGIDTETVDTETVDTETEEETPYFWYLRCNTTSWNLDDVSQLVDTDDANVKTLVFEVTQPWMVTGGDSCSVVRTETEKQWWPGLTFFSSDTNPVIVDGGGTLVVSFGQFGVRYPALGTYEFLLNTDDNTFTIGAVGTGGPTCDDGVQNGDETDVDCGGSVCGGCTDGQSCIVNSDCLSNHCGDGFCFTPVDDCDAESAIDLGATGQFTVVPSDGCVKVEAGYPGWWKTRTMNLMNPDGSNYPIPFTWENTCSGGSGEGSFTANWQSQYLTPTSDECPTVINLLGNGSSDITLQYFGL